MQHNVTIKLRFYQCAEWKYTRTVYVAGFFFLHCKTICIVILYAHLYHLALHTAPYNLYKAVMECLARTWVAMQNTEIKGFHPEKNFPFLAPQSDCPVRRSCRSDLKAWGIRRIYHFIYSLGSAS